MMNAEITFSMVAYQVKNKVKVKTFYYNFNYQRHGHSPVAVIPNTLPKWHVGLGMVDSSCECNLRGGRSTAVFLWAENSGSEDLSVWPAAYRRTLRLFPGTSFIWPVTPFALDAA